ncbi:hypothetical protein CHS0354_022694 [Potamilus streckersoni]|uniref:Protein quiver n=1 Tax=Potamilus streckersoni TaxID=2493646 RepID=A0AAE0SHY0_9BIVA|nr:hypothetical protein CHS0354_022694 [Potamilus streckersoni]
MENPHTKFLLFLGILMWLRQADAINCYSCSLEGKCNDPFKSSGVSTSPCSGPCYKSKASNANAQAVIRGCETIIQTEDKCTDVQVNGITAKVCWCNENLCNYALPVGSSIIIMTALIAIYIALHERE